MLRQSGHSANGKSSRKQRSEEEIFNMMEEYERSESFSARDFCELHDISDGTFYNWQKRYRQRNEPGAPKGFLQVEVVAASVPAPDAPSDPLTHLPPRTIAPSYNHFALWQPLQSRAP